ncbi:GntR family transcriptional regulator [Aurantimonas sp. VKM B-3413]|uniref:GntR family transcriptional regulator n=1 Tax=Aurantimonas sp. VKM B-3413 TaxID=2779401 RepID=UPI001E49BE0F|nr:GntR family transcriptional regulator [Aurantimonas sp. VKM B-3413]MCB8837947.1 GntR family transcriptional regulator [Aurantimonas sp. VKM B-3413]
MMKLDEKAPIAPQIYTGLRQAIIRMRFMPGQALSEKEIASLFGSSRQPAREALIKLAEAGLVRILPQRGSYVVKVSPRAVGDARFVREAVEVAVARTACRIASDKSLAGLGDLVRRQSEAAAAGDNDLFLTLDEAFHRGLAEAVDCAEAWRVVENGKAQMDRVRYLSLPEASPMTLLIEQHEDILNAIRARDAEAAAAAMRIHLREILLALPRLAAQRPELFDDEALPAHAEDLRAALGRAGPTLPGGDETAPIAAAGSRVPDRTR